MRHTIHMHKLSQHCCCYRPQFIIRGGCISSILAAACLPAERNAIPIGLSGCLKIRFSFSACKRSDWECGVQFNMTNGLWIEAVSGSSGTGSHALVSSARWYEAEETMAGMAGSEIIRFAFLLQCCM